MGFGNPTRIAVCRIQLKVGSHRDPGGIALSRRDEPGSRFEVGSRFGWDPSKKIRIQLTSTQIIVLAG
jgi:hypothetical protein